MYVVGLAIKFGLASRNGTLLNGWHDVRRMEEDGNGQGVTMAIANPEASDIGIFTIKKCGV